MKRFSFRLEKLLRLKREAEGKLAQRLAEVILDVEAARVQAGDSATRKWEAEQQMAHLRTEPVPAGALVAAEHALRAVRGQADRHARAHRLATVELDKERTRFHEAQQERKSLERLREKKHAEWMSEMRRMDQTENDEVAARMRRSVSGGHA